MRVNSLFGNSADSFAVYYYTGASGFDATELAGYSVLEIDPVAHPKAIWLLENEYPYNADLLTDRDDLGVPLLLKYALNGSPHDLESDLYTIEVLEDSIQMDFHAAQSDVQYVVERSVDLKLWTDAGVSMSASDASGMRTATTSTEGLESCFLRVSVSFL